MTPWPDIDYSTVQLPDIPGQIWAPNMPQINGSYNGGAFVAEEGTMPGFPNGVSFSEEGIPFMPGSPIPPDGPPGAVVNCWGPASPFPGITAVGRVGFASIPADGRAVCAWADPNNDFRITLSYLGTDQIWQTPFALEEKSFCGVDICLDAANAWSVLLTWAGTDLGDSSSGTINFAAMPWENQALTLKNTYWGQTAFGTPSVAVSNEYTFIAWAGTDSAHSLNVLKVQPITMADVVVWESAQVILGEQTTCPPRLAYAYSPTGGPDMLILTWLGTDGQLNMLTLDTDSGDGTKYIATFPGVCTCAPTVLALGWWYMFWVNDNLPWVAASQTIGTPQASWNTALGLNTPYTWPSVDGGALAWDMTGDGLEIGYRGQLVADGPSPNGTPCVTSLSLDPTQWVLGGIV